MAVGYGAANARATLIEEPVTPAQELSGARSTEPFLPSATSQSVLTGSNPRSWANGQQPARRRADRLWLRHFVRPERSMTSLVGDHGRTVLDAVTAGHVPPMVAIPLALLVLAVVLNTLISGGSLVINRAGIVMPVAGEELLLAEQSAPGAVTNGEPLSIDPTNYEKIRRTEYEVVTGDTISEIAVAHDLDPGTILAMNPIADVRRLLPGTTLYIPNRDGLPHAVQPGESLSGISDSYGIPVSAILDANDLDSTTLQVGDVLFIPGATMDDQDYLLAIGELFRWPVRSYTFTSGYGMRIHPISGIWHMHTGIDLANRVGTPIIAAGSGTVVHVENQVSNYGRVVIIDHGNGYRTLYAHLHEAYVSMGEYVSTGQQIGTMGNTGRSTGPHLHFSVFRGSQPIDPMSQLGDR
jgi:murein DD-endopeptidase MepM/ murein hydrolase activator NlpD